MLEIIKYIFIKFLEVILALHGVFHVIEFTSAIYEEVSLSREAVLKKLGDVDPGSLDAYDQMFIGSPIHAGTIAKEVQDFLEKLPQLPNMRLAGFITHAATAYPKQTLDQMTQPLVDICKAKKITYAGCFNCQGYLADFMHTAVQKMQEMDYQGGSLFFRASMRLSIVIAARVRV